MNCEKFPPFCLLLYACIFLGFFSGGGEGWLAFFVLSSVSTKGPAHLEKLFFVIVSVFVVLLLVLAGVVLVWFLWMWIGFHFLWCGLGRGLGCCL